MIGRLVKTGKSREFLSLFFPVLLVAFSSSLYLMLEKVLLGASSGLAMQAAVAVAYIAQIFQLSTVAITMMCQVFIGQQYGERNWKAMGPCLWQYIWFSIFSTFIVLPMGVLYGSIYLEGTPFQDIATPYLYSVLLINFLFPLGTAFSCFYISQGKTLLVLISSFAAQVLKVFLAYLLIPRLAAKNPLWGLYGGTISTFIAQFLFILVLFFFFMRRKNQNVWDSGNYRFRLRLFWDCVRPGLLRGMNRLLNTFCWASISRLMISKTQTHGLVFSIGGVLFLFLPFLGDAICQAQTVIVSRILGANRFFALSESWRAGFSFATASIALFAIPLLLFPGWTYGILFPKIPLDLETVRPIFWGIWASFAFFTWAYVPVGYILAFKDMMFSAFMGIFGWFNGYLYVYFMIEKMEIEAKYAWLVLSAMHGSNLLIYHLRAKVLCSRSLKVISV